MRVDFLVGDVRRYVDEVAGFRFRDVFEGVSPSHSSLPADDVDDAFEVAVVMRPGLRIRMDGDGTCPQFIGAGHRVIDRCRPVHPGCLRCVGVHLGGFNDSNTVVLPV